MISHNYETVVTHNTDFGILRKSSIKFLESGDHTCFPHLFA